MQKFPTVKSHPIAPLEAKTSTVRVDALPDIPSLGELRRRCSVSKWPQPTRFMALPRSRSFAIVRHSDVSEARGAMVTRAHQKDRLKTNPALGARKLKLGTFQTNLDSGCVMPSTAGWSSTGRIP